MEKMKTALLYLKKDDKILLVKTKNGPFKDKMGGIVVKIEDWETEEEALIRGTNAEISTISFNYEKVGILDCLEYVNGELCNNTIQVYFCTEWDIEPQESKNATPYWVSIDEIPYEKMFSEDEYWLPRVLNGEKIYGHFQFDENRNILQFNIELLEEHSKKI